MRRDDELDSQDRALDALERLAAAAERIADALASAGSPALTTQDDSGGTGNGPPDGVGGGG